MKIKLSKDIYFSNCSGVFQGGGCKAIAYIGAYQVAYEHGIMFSELAGTSAGSIIAAAIALGATPDQIKSFVSNLDFSKLVRVSNIPYERIPLKQLLNVKPQGFMEKAFWKLGASGIERGIYGKLQSLDNVFFQNLDPQRILNEYGLFDSNYLKLELRNWFEILTNKPDPKFEDLSVNLHVLAGDVPGHKMKVFNNVKTPEISIAEAVTASCSIPIFFTPPDKKYIDGGILSNRPDILIENKANYFRTLSFSLKSEGSHIENLMDFVSSIIDTVIIGADEIQHKDNRDVDCIEILCKDIRATDFDKMDSSNINLLIDTGARAMKTFFQKLDASDSKFGTPNINLHSIEQVYSQIAHWSYDKIDSILVVSESLDWVWKLFPSIISWSQNNTKLKVSYVDIKKDKEKRKIINRLKGRGKSSDEAEKRYLSLVDKQEAILRFLRAVNARVSTRNSDTPEGFYFKTGSRSKAVLYKRDASGFTGKIYMDDLDSFALNKILGNNNEKGLGAFRLNVGKENEIIGLLQKIDMYSKATFEWTNIAVKQLKFLNKFIRGDKYKQIYNVFNLYPDDTDTFTASSITLKNGKESFVGPIVVEEHDGKYFVIEGNTRSLFAYKHKIKEIRVLLVKGVSEDLPLDMQHTPDGYDIDQVRISEKGLEAEDRYEGFRYDLFRPIEQTLRPDDNYLL